MNAGSREGTKNGIFRLFKIDQIESIWNRNYLIAISVKCLILRWSSITFKFINTTDWSRNSIFFGCHDQPQLFMCKYLPSTIWKHLHKFTVDQMPSKIVCQERWTVRINGDVWWLTIYIVTFRTTLIFQFQCKS